ncbi:putative gustatory receptor 28a isoform X1 [Drosophila albomicans]|uniref:Gustatory receptor 28a isoform X1 n=1 Tax=Drosophila albomicans TaxID=7291 RepID=A0A6P8W8W3_DROAB|nr:putative gustatory receptor 28a isoform X1 [Drosophila albomicans]
MFFKATQMNMTTRIFLKIILQDILDAHIEQNAALELSPMHSAVNHQRCAHRLRNMISTPMQRYSVTSIIRQNPDYAMKQVSNIHNLLCDICQTIEEYFTYPLLGIIAISFLFILFDDFYILEAMMNPKRLDYFEADEFFAFFLIQMIWYIVIIFLIVEASSKTIRHSSYSAAIVHKILNITDDLELRDRLFRLSLQLSHRKVSFTAAGLFRLDRTLIFTITGAATCYLIILIQFRSMHETQSATNATNNM